MMCYYLNVHFQGQRFNSGEVLLDFSHTAGEYMWGIIVHVQFSDSNFVTNSPLYHEITYIAKMRMLTL